MTHSAEKGKRGTLWDLLTYILLQNIKKTRRGTFETFETLKNFREKSHSAEKNQKGGPFSLVWFFRLR